ncbi:Glycosyltransferase, GT2 family [Thermomonospora echinospora]|uniref:Glycosyltransferase, GT2 family n=1 Tax=Thermomonospora echinospora TaxID=1992 RepID=A0A1H6D3G0_9ACTN|nr:glycosyltransferase [Thermomonospora echinospora]SEG79528.1 Glycosyltransferase, GT2 family [Thermomonospora echinospora]
MTAGERVVAVIVTYNRRGLLEEALTAVTGQTRRPDVTVVVDNASTDGTRELLAARAAELEKVALEHNTGGAGGFAAGVARALELGADRIWLLDDDTVPEPGALAALLRVCDGAALVASRVVWTDGRAHPMNTPRPKPGASRAEQAAAQALGCVPIRSASFVSVLVDAAVVRERGLPIADYFLWNDDFEFTTRILRGRRGLLCPDSVVVHKTRTFGSTDADPGERFFYEVRNKVWLFTRSGGLAPAERVVYGGSTVRRWAKTFVRSSDRATLRRGLARGLAAGLRGGPRPNAEVLNRAGFPAARRAR